MKEKHVDNGGDEAQTMVLDYLRALTLCNDVVPEKGRYKLI